MIFSQTNMRRSKFAFVKQRTMDEWTNGWTDAIDAPENNDFPTDYAIFSKANKLTNQWTALPFYRDAKAVSKNIFANQKKSQVYSIFHGFCLLCFDVE